SPAARVLAAALRTWTHLRRGRRGRSVLRFDVRDGAQRHEYLATVDLRDEQAAQLLALLRAGVERAAGPMEAHIDGSPAEPAAAGRARVRAADLLTAAHRASRSKREIADHISWLVETGRLRETWRPGVYRIPPPSPAWSIRPGMPTARAR